MKRVKEKIEAIKREIGYRRRVYARAITRGQMMRELAETQIKIFEDILEDYEGLEKLECLL